ncbi:MAG: RloB family protein [Propionibacteriaceae bacterium]|jgi:hypothetical protein|nr:RloB family protein [Propionibacteriaceae bacterium]
MSVRRNRGGKSLKRKVGTRPVKRIIVAFCEGEGSEPDYIKGLQRLPEVAGNAALSIELSDRHGVPYTLVDNAVALKKTDPEVDECWCLFDVEWPQNHPRLSDAIGRADSVAGVYVAVSNPCFEVWLIMHHKNVTAFLTTDQAEQFSRAADERPGKHINADLYMPKRGDAVRRAETLEQRHHSNGTVSPHDNPSSGVFRFLRAVGADPTTGRRY